MSRTSVLSLSVVFVCAGTVACEEPRAEGGATEAVADSLIRTVEEATARALAAADSVERNLLPVPLLTPAQQAALRRSDEAVHLRHARALGVRPADPSALDSLRRAGDLVALDSSEYWIVRELEHSLPLVTPATRSMLERIGTRFQERLAGLGLPAYRLEVTSALRTGELQEGLRAANPNAARGVSAHEYGTTVDIAYSGFAAPLDPEEVDAASLERLTPVLARIRAGLLESAAARMSRELQAILGEVLIELQAEGALVVTLEQQQPVYHVTVARR